MSDATTHQLVLLQHGDNFFPSGSVAFSFGLETLINDGLVRDGSDVQKFLRGQICCRWAHAERVVLAAAWRCDDDLAALQKVDAVQEAMSLSYELRQGSRRAGAALLTIHRRLDTLGAEKFSALIARGDTPGHLSVVQGMVWCASGLSLEDCAILSAHTFCVGVLGAALRLGVIGHVAAQEILGALHPTITAVINQPVAALEHAWAYAPLGEIASMRHQDQALRLFST